VETGVIFLLVVAAGYLFGRAGIITAKEREGATKILFYILLPSLVAGGIMGAPIDRDLWVVFFGTMILTLLIWAASLLVFMQMMEPNTARIAAMASVLGNTGFIGFPLIERLVGENALHYAAVFSVGQAIVLLTIVFPSLGGRFDPKKLLNPPLMGVIIGAILKALSPLLPAAMWNVIVETAKFMGSASGPLVMLVIGSTIRKFQMKKTDLAVAVVKLVISPALFHLALSPFVGPLALKTATIQAMTPTLMAAPIYTKEAGLGEEEASRIVTYTTALFLAALPFIGRFL
jgi:predicted permease